jgi:outer membrane protein assembly factor BamD (BamD/ComL family)
MDEIILGDSMNKLKKFVSKMERLSEGLEKTVAKHRKNRLANVKIVKRYEKLYKESCKEKIESDKLVSMQRTYLDEVMKKLDCIEETYYILYSNIKRNQFLFAHYPKDWDKDWMEIRDKLKEENNEIRFS